MRGNNKLTEIQILRAVAFIFVILQHSLGSAIVDATEKISYIYFDGILFVFAETAVPIFLFISGLTFIYSYKDKFDVVKYYKNRILYLIIPYFIWSFINMALYNPERLNNFFIETLAGNGRFHLWYMGMMIRLILIFPIILYVGRFIHRQNVIVKIGVFISICIGYYEITANQWRIEEFIGKALFGIPTPVEERLIGISILFWSYFLFLGVFVGFNYDLFKKQIIKFRYIIYGVFIFTFMYKFQIKYDAIEYNKVWCMMYRTANIGFFYLVALKIIEIARLKNLFEFIGKYSYAGYMIHPTILYFIIMVLEYLGVNPIINGVVSCALSAIIIPLIIYWMTYIKNSKYITGIKN